MSGFRIEGNTSGNVAEVDVNNNLKIVLPQDADSAGYVLLAGELGSDTDPAGPLTQKIRTSAQGRLTVGQPVMLFNEVFNQAAQNTALFNTALTTFTVTYSGVLTLNAGSSVAASAVAVVKTYQFFPIQSDFATMVVWDMALTQAPTNNNTVEGGLFLASGVTLPTDGALFRYDATGTLKAVLNTNGVEVTSAALTAPSAGVMHKYKIICENDRVLYYIDDILQAVILSPTSSGMPMFSQSQPFCVREFNGGVSPALAQSVKVGYIFVGLQDAAGLNKPYPHLASASGKMLSQGQTGQTMGSTALYTNSLAPGAGVAPTNTTAALGSGLGGQFAALPTLAANTDGIISSYQNPVGTAALSGKTLFITGVKIQGMVSTVLAGGPVLYAYSLAYGHTAVSLATAEAVGAKAPRRVPLGYETYAAAAAIGTLGSANGVLMTFNSPITVNPGEFIQIVAKNIGTVTTTGVITIQVAFDGYWE